MAGIVLCCDGTWNSTDQAEVNEEPGVTNVQDRVPLEEACARRLAPDRLLRAGRWGREPDGSHRRRRIRQGDRDATLHLLGNPADGPPSLRAAAGRHRPERSERNRHLHRQGRLVARLREYPLRHHRITLSLAMSLLQDGVRKVGEVHSRVRGGCGRMSGTDDDQAAKVETNPIYVYDPKLRDSMNASLPHLDIREPDGTEPDLH